MELASVVIYILIAVGILFNGLGSLGLIRFPDVYTRLHAATKCTTFGSIFIIIAVVLYSIVENNLGDKILAVHSVIALVVLFITNPTGAHAIARAAHRSGVLPKNAICDKLAGVKSK